MFYLCETDDSYLSDGDVRACSARISFAATLREEYIQIYCKDGSAFLMS